MQTSSIVSSVPEMVFEFACGLGAAGRIFTMQQLARHPHLSWRTQPVKRASEMLAPFRDSFELVPWERTFLWRLSEREKRKRGLNYRNVGASQHVPHWLALGDMWAQLVFHGMRPEKWFTEGRDIGRFDAFMVVGGASYLIELQRTPLPEREWQAKWRRRAEWLRLQKWKEPAWADRFCAFPPRVLLITTQPMDALIPRGVIHVRDISQLHHALRK
jgi:hypothetical protein